MKFELKYFIAAIAFFVIEVCIALYVFDDFVRPYLGDVLVVVLLYCAIKAVFRISYNIALLYVLLFAIFVEFLQYINFVEQVELQEYKLARVVIGTSFSWIDIFCYTLGILAVFAVEKARLGRNSIRSRN
ncbi:MAG TPA: DUF2809 domain-containing protein [Flavobacterium sp.]|jgi:hypothetical protein